MRWLEWAGMVAGLTALLVVWDLVFCGGRRCGRFANRLLPGERGGAR